MSRLILFALPLLVAVEPANGQETSGQAAASGTFELGDSKFEFADAVAFQTTRLNRWPDQPVTVVVLTVEPIARDEVTSSVQQSGDWTAPDHTRLILQFDNEGQLLGGVFLGYTVEAGAFQIAPNPTVVETETVLTEEGIRGSAVVSEKQSYFGEEYTFDVEFVAEVVAGAGRG